MTAAALADLGPGVAPDAEHLLRLRHWVRADRAAPRAATALPGGFVVRRRGRGLEVDDIRLFAEGDDLRHLDRNATARTGEPHVRTFRDERERTLLLLVDLRPSMLWGTRRALRSAAAVEAAALAGWRALETGGRIGLLAFGVGEPVVVPARGRVRGMIAVAGGLAVAHDAALAGALGAGPWGGSPQTRSPSDEPSLAAGLRIAARLAPKGATVLLVSGFDHPGADFDEAAGLMMRRSDLAALVVVDALEARADGVVYPFLDPGGALRRGRIAAPFDRTTDPRFLALDRLAVAAAPIRAEAGPAAMVEALEALDGRR
ncbi:hypothetical protein ABB55_08395 [Prosthecomicrobium hirschii]|uniref:DUF58 domain-containing protein n=1 Tax=Prosthecodimorpha hirschii TaxID=665126 RepID=A0A0N8GER4_9HYPH|nr:DUF58 domain-containing protein [Prosthecomicrobium hirschii]KPL52249.1 hypothetical protein ABB55_08395 [Prosthecomicrobium hirschii]